MAILGPDGQVIDNDGRGKPVMRVESGASLRLAMHKASRIETPDSILEFEPGEWLIIPLVVWQRLLTQAMQAETRASEVEQELAAQRGRPKRRN